MYSTSSAYHAQDHDSHGLVSNQNFEAQASLSQEGQEGQQGQHEQHFDLNGHSEYVIRKGPQQPPVDEAPGVVAYAEQLVHGGGHRLAQARDWLMQTLFSVQSNRLSITLVAVNFFLLFCNFALHLQKPYQFEAIASQFLFNVVLMGVPALLFPGVFYIAFSSFLLYRYLTTKRGQTVLFF